MTLDSTKIQNILAYPIHLLTYEWEESEELNSELRQMILDKEQKTEGLTQSNVGGFHSDWDLLTWGGDAISEFIKRIQSFSQIMADIHGLEKDKDLQLSLTAWGNVIRSGGYHIAHSHPNSHWSGVYYVDVGKIDKNHPYNGCLEFVDPRSGANMVTVDSLPLLNRYHISPMPGLMILFPAYLEHFVHPFIGEGERINIAFNVKIL